MALKLRKNNPYANGFIISQEDREFLKRPVIDYPEFNEGDESYILKDGDYLWSLAFRFYGDSKLWWVIADVNNIFNVLELTTGQELVIPSYETIKAIV